MLMLHLIVQSYRREWAVQGNVTRIIDAKAVAQIVSEVGLERLYDLSIARLESVIADHNDDLVEMKTRDGFVLASPHRGLVEWMPAIRHGALVTVKIVGYHPDNPAKYRAPTINSTLYAFDAATGHLRSIIDGTFTTAVRTGAASALASRLLAQADSTVLGIIGCGAQAVTQLHALSRVFDIREVLVSDVDAAAEAGFARRAPFCKADIRVSSPQEIERYADIICTATSVAPGAAPVLSGTDLRPHAHINAVGSDMPGKIELPLELLRSALVCPDHPAQAAVEGECQRLSPDEIGPSLFDLVKDPKLAVAHQARRTIFDSTGLALQDLAMAELFEELAESLNAGHQAVIEANAGDPQDPYGFLHPSPEAAGSPSSTTR